MNNSRLLKQAASIIGSKPDLNKNTIRAPSKGILKKSTVFTNASDDIDSSVNTAGFSNELMKVKKRIRNSKSISFFD